METSNSLDTVNSLLQKLIICPPARLEILRDLQNFILNSKNDIVFNLQTIKDSFKSLLDKNAIFYTPILTEWSLDMVWELTHDGFIMSGQSLESQIEKCSGDVGIQCLLGVLDAGLKKLVEHKQFQIFNMLFNGFLRFNPVFNWILAYYGIKYPNHIIPFILSWGGNYLSENKLFLLNLKNSNPMVTSCIEVFNHVTQINDDTTIHIYKFIESCFDVNSFNNFGFLFSLQMLLYSVSTADKILTYFIDFELSNEMIQKVLSWISVLGPNEHSFFFLISSILLSSNYGFYFIKQCCVYLESSSTNKQIIQICTQILMEITEQLRKIYLGFSEKNLNMFRLSQDILVDIDFIMQCCNSKNPVISSFATSLLMWSLITDKDNSIEILCKLFVDHFNEKPIPSEMMKIYEMVWFKQTDMPQLVVKELIKSFEKFIESPLVMQRIIVFFKKIIFKDDELVKMLIDALCTNISYIDLNSIDFYREIFYSFIEEAKPHIVLYELFSKISKKICSTIKQKIISGEEENLSDGLIEFINHNMIFFQCTAEFIIIYFFDKSITDEDIKYELYLMASKILANISSGNLNTESFKVATEFVHIIRINFLEYIIHPVSLKDGTNPSLRELDQNYITSSTNTDVYLLVKSNQFMIYFISELIEIFSANQPMRCLGFDLCRSVLVHGIHATQKKGKLISQSAYLEEYVKCLGSILPILTKLIDDLPLFMSKCDEILPFLSSYEGNLILSDIYNFCRRSINARDAKYRFNSVMQANIEILSSRFHLLKNS